MPTPLLTHSLGSLQPEATNDTTTAAPRGEQGPSGPPPGACGGGALGTFLPLLVMIVVFWFLIIRPQQKRQRQHDDMLKSLQKGDKVRTTGGIRGDIVELGEADVVVQIADRVKINVLRSHIASKEAKPTEAQGKD